MSVTQYNICMSADSKVTCNLVFVHLLCSVYLPINKTGWLSICALMQFTTLCMNLSD